MAEINNLAQEQIDKIRQACERIKPIVVIQCTAYNHESYIKDALEGFVMQETDFPFVAIVHEDVSTDNTAEIIKEYAEKYPNIILPIFEKENQYSKGTLGKVMNEACKATGAKYIAMCEGDDYWTDSLKLQKQVDFLESHPDYGMCYTKVKQYNQNHNIFLDIWGGPNEKFEELLLNNTIPTLSILLKREIYEKYYLEINPGSHKDWLMGDYPLWLYVVKKSKIYFLDEVTGVYRILQNSASHFDNPLKKLYFIQSGYKIRNFFATFYSFKNKKKIHDILIWIQFKIDLYHAPITKKEFKHVYSSLSNCRYKIFIIVLCHIPHSYAKKIIEYTVK